MPLLMRRAVFRTGLAASGTLAAALLARKLWPEPSGGVSGGDPGETEPGRTIAGPPPLRDVALALRAVRPPSAVPKFPVAVSTAVGQVATRPASALFGPRGTVLNFWATWCAPCRTEMGSLARLAAALGPAGIAVLPVSLDRGGVAVVRAFFRQNGISGLPVIADPGGLAETSLSLGAIPVTLVLDGNGAVVGRLEGGADWGTPAAARSVRAMV